MPGFNKIALMKVNNELMKTIQGSKDFKMFSTALPDK
jgi:hypothetical protein